MSAPTFGFRQVTIFRQTCIPEVSRPVGGNKPDSGFPNLYIEPFRTAPNKTGKALEGLDNKPMLPHAVVACVVCRRCTSWALPRGCSFHRSSIFCCRRPLRESLWELRVCCAFLEGSVYGVGCKAKEISAGCGSMQPFRQQCFSVLQSLNMLHKSIQMRMSLLLSLPSSWISWMFK